jgi:hypothetical protein
MNNILIFREVVGVERGPLILANTIEELLQRKLSGSGLEIQEYGHRESVTLTTWHPQSEKVVTNSADKRRSLADLGHGVSIFFST